MPLRLAVIASAAAGLLTMGAAAAAPSGPDLWNGGWKAADDHTVYLSIAAGRRIYRLDMAGSCPTLLDPDATLITDYHTDTICTALDWNLRVRRRGGIPTPCIVAKMTRLTLDQAAALPKNLRP